ncbi:MAG: MraY family glycosyltransferase [Candidatus Omnitrophota bacterium]
MIYILLFILALVITPLIRKAALRMNWVDKADGDALKIHKKPVALLGGAVIVIACLLGVGLLARSPQSIAHSKMQIMGIIFGAVLVFGVGLWDDLKKISLGIRLFSQLLAGVIILLAGIRVEFIPIGWVAVLFTLFYIAGAINAFNVIDGMDGLCAGVSLVSCIGFFFLGIGSENMFLAGFSAILFMSLLGFLPYNFHQAKIFLGDAGSGLLGFLLGVMAVMATSTAYNAVNFIVPILIISVPVFDIALAIIRRLIQRRPLFFGDRNHVYDLLLKKGWSQPRVWCIMCTIQGIIVGIALVVASKK